MRYLRTYKQYRREKFTPYRAVIGTIWFLHGKLKNKHMSRIQSTVGYAKIFKEDSYRSKVCATCRTDTPREQMAKKADYDGERAVAKSGGNGKPVQNLHCKYCDKHKPWWWFAKLPVDGLEEIAVMERGGKAW